LHSFALQCQRHRAARALRLVPRLLPDRPQIAGHLVREHLLHAQPEQVRRMAAVGTRGDVAAESRCAARPAVTAGAALDQSSADRAFGRYVADAVVSARPEALAQRELALAKLTRAAHSTRRITRPRAGGGRAGPRALMKEDEAGVSQSPTPAPIC